MSEVTTLAIIQGLSRRLRGLSQSKDRRHALIRLRWTATLSKIERVGMPLSGPEAPPERPGVLEAQEVFSSCRRSRLGGVCPLGLAHVLPDCCLQQCQRRVHHGHLPPYPADGH